jgi:hypothetical protein
MNAVALSCEQTSIGLSQFVCPREVPYTRWDMHSGVPAGVGSYRTVIGKGVLEEPSTATARGTCAPPNDCVRTN